MGARRGWAWRAVAVGVLMALLAAGLSPARARAEDGGDSALTGQSASVSAPRVVADSSMESGQVATWDCVWLGSYPQAEVAPSDPAYASLESAAWDGRGDATVGDARYRRISKSDATYDGYWDDDGYGSADWRYFRYEPIKWRVLSASGGTALAVADVALDCQKYNTNWADVTWETCSLRSWLNGYGAGSNQPGADYGANSFVAAAFTEAERGAVLATEVTNDDNTEYGTDGGADTTDAVFLLSESEACDAGHGFAGSHDTLDEARRCKASDYARAMGALRSTDSYYYGNCWWWLRSPGDASGACYVSCVGCVRRLGFFVYDDGAVRPALNLNLSSSSIQPAGTVSSDGTVVEENPPATGGTDSHDLANAQISTISVQSYTGDPVEPDFTVRMGLSTLLRKGDDYTVSYSDNVEVGTAKVTVTGVGTYHGSITRNFRISNDSDVLFGGKELDLGFGSSSFTLDDDVPILGGDTFKLDFPVELPIQTVFEDGKVKVGINLPEPYLSGSGSTAKAWEWTTERGSMKEQWEDFCKNAGKTKDLFKGGGSGFINKISDGRWQRCNIPGISGKVEAYAAGYLEYAYGDKLSDAAKLEGSIVLTVKGSATAQKQWVVWVIPVTGSITFSAEGTATGRLAWDFANSTWSGDVELAIAIGLEPYVGVGVGQWASVGVYGSAKTGVEITVLSRSEAHGLREWYLSGDAGGRAYFAKKAFTWTIISTADLRKGRLAKYTDSSGHLRLWSKTQASVITGNTGAGLKAQSIDAGEELLASAETLPATSEEPLLMAASDGSLVDGAYPGAQPAVLEAGGTRVLVYVGQDLSRPELDQTVLYYRVFDAGSDAWGDPVPVLDDGTADCMPTVLVDGDEAYVAWLDASESFGDDVDLNAYMTSFSARVARWDAASGSFVDLGRPAGDDAGYAYLVALGAGESGPVATWAENADSTPFGLSAGNSVRQASFDGTAWGDPAVLADGLNAVTSLAVHGGEAAWAVDEDNDLATTGQLVGSTEGQLPSADVASLTYAELPGVGSMALVANIAGGLSYCDGSDWVEVLPEGTMGASSTFWVDGNSVYYVRAEENASHVAVATYDDGEWGNALVTTDDGYVDSLSDPCGVIALTHTVATPEEGTNVRDTSSEVRVLPFKERANVALEAADFASEDLEPGATVPVTLYVTNEGTSRIYSASWGASLDGTELASGVAEVDLMPGETGSFEVELALPEDLGEGALSFWASCDGDDDADDGSQQVEVVKPDLAVSARFFEGTVGQDGSESTPPALVVTVANVGTADTDARTSVSDEAGNVLLEEAGTIAAGESATYTKEFGSGDTTLPADGGEVVFIARTETDAEEFYESNNVDYAVASMKYLDAEGEVVDLGGFENPFIDVSTETAHEEDILWLAQQKISEGWTLADGKREFRPYSTVARADMAAFLFRLARLWGVVDDTWQPSGGSSFSDVTNTTAHYREVMWLAESGISEGWKMANGTRQFRPYASVARADMAAFLARLARLADRGAEIEGVSDAFSDVTSDTAHADDIAWLAASGVSRGWDMSDGTRQFRPLARVARADMAAFLHRLDALE